MLCWIWCDIDGTGRCWRLAIERGDDLYFPIENFEEKGKVFENYPSIEIEKPDHVPRVRCSVCKIKRPATKQYVFYDRGKPFCCECWNDYLRILEERGRGD